VPEAGSIALFFGGRSVEHEVSIRSARSVMVELEGQGWKVFPVAVDREGRWFTADNPLGVRGSIPEGTRRPVKLRAEPGAGLETGEGKDLQWVYPDLYFPLIHGRGGEDGTLQGLLNLAEAPYAGSGVLASALAMDKDLAKVVLRQTGLPVLDWLVVSAADWRRKPDAIIGKLQDSFPGSVFIKPANGGSSIGTSRAASVDARRQALDLALSLDLKAIVEPAVDAREIEVSVLGNDDIEASVAGEIVPAGEFYDYHAKYCDGGTRLLVPAPLQDDAMDHVRDLACRAYAALNCRGFGRVDFLMDRATGEPYISELNTLPGFTDVSMFPRLWEASGLAYGPLLARIVELGKRRARARKSLRHEIEEPGS